MWISNLILSKQGTKEKKNKAREINVYRIILLLCSTFTLLLRYLLVKEFPNPFDPFLIRVGFSFMLLVIFALTYFKSWANKFIYFNYVIFVLYSFYALLLIHKNNFSISYILEFIIITIIICLAFKHKLHINIYLAIVFFSYTLSCFIFIDKPMDIFVHVVLLGIFCGAIITFFDLKIETETELRVREDLLNTVFNESPDALFLVDPSNSLIINCNERALAIFEVDTQNKIIGNNHNYLLKYPHSPSSWKNLKNKVGKKRFLIQELEFKTTTNHVFWGSEAITEINVANEIYWLVRITDITEKVKDKKTIEENRKMLRQVVDLVPHQIFLKDNQGKILLVNKAVAEIFGTVPDNLIGKRDVDFAVYDEAKKFMEDDREVIEKGKEKFTPEDYLTSKDGSTRILQTIRIPFYFEDENKPGVLGISIDITERVKDKITIDENTKMLRQIIDLVPPLIYLKDSAGKFLLVNQAVADILQMSKEDVIGKSNEDFFNKKEADVMKKIEGDVIAKGRTRFIQESFTDKEGNIRILNTVKMPFFLSNKNEMGILGVDIDITEEKAAEKTIKESEAKYRLLMEQASDGIYLSDEKGNILDANLKACEMFGYTLDEFLKLNIKKLIDPNGISDSPLRIPNAKDKQSIIVERRFIKKDCTPFTVELSAKLLEDGRHQAIIRDITERKRLERILKDNERKFRALIENSSDIIIILGEDFKLKYTSPSVKRILGYDPEKVVNKLIFEVVHHEDLDSISKFLSDILLKPGENHVIDEIRIRSNLDNFIYAEIVAANLLADPTINGIIINCHDITKRKSTEKELLNANFELDSFVYKASHDLKAPLRSVMGLIKLAKMESKDERQHVYLEMMNKSVTSLDLFIKDLTQFSRNSRLEVEAMEINFEKIIDDSLTNLKFMDNVEKVVVNKMLVIESTFYSDLTRVSTIFNNLISNAFKYHRFNENNSYINIKIEANSEKAKIVVEDNGLGIDPLHINRIFEMFYRASEVSYGSGLGLYIVKNAVSKLNGIINVESVVDQGSTFTIVIPNLIKKIQNNEG